MTEKKSLPETKIAQPFRKVEVTIDKDLREDFLRQLEANARAIAIVTPEGKSYAIGYATLNERGDVIVLHARNWEGVE